MVFSALVQRKDELFSKSRGPVHRSINGHESHVYELRHQSQAFWHHGGMRAKCEGTSACSNREA
eukprot:544895-Pelagomonas_calceolata.AAC.2